MFPQLFQRRSSKDKAEKTVAQEMFETLILARFDRLEHNFAALRTEWADTYDKVMHLYDRARKRIKAAEVAPEDEKPIVPAMSPTEQRELVLRRFIDYNGR